MFTIERQFVRAAVFAAAGALLTFFGLMHGEAIGVAESPLVALAYLGVGAVLLTCTRVAAPATAEPVEHAPAAASVGS